MVDDRLSAVLAQQRSFPHGVTESIASFDVQGESFEILRTNYKDPHATDPLRIAIFGGIHGDEQAGSLAILSLLKRLEQEPALAEGYELFTYPVCNPTGYQKGTRHSHHGVDLNRQFWRESTYAEIQALEKELHQHHFQGIIQLHADDTSDGIYGFVRGATLTENLLRPALAEAGKILPRNVSAQIDGFAARDGIIYEHYEGILAAPNRIDPAPFEIVFETPALAPMELQVAALVKAITVILAEYRRFISFAQDL